MHNVTKISISNQFCSFELAIHQRILKMCAQKYQAVQLFSTFLSSKSTYYLLSEGSFDTEDWSNDAENSALPSQE